MEGGENLRVKAQNQILEVNYAYAFTEKDIEMDNHTTTIMNSPTSSDDSNCIGFKESLYDHAPVVEVKGLKAKDIFDILADIAKYNYFDFDDYVTEGVEVNVSL